MKACRGKASLSLEVLLLWKQEGLTPRSRKELLHAAQRSLFGREPEHLKILKAGCLEGGRHLPASTQQNKSTLSPLNAAFSPLPGLSAMEPASIPSLQSQARAYPAHWPAISCRHCCKFQEMCARAPTVSCKVSANSGATATRSLSGEEGSCCLTVWQLCSQQGEKRKYFRLEWNVYQSPITK